MASFGLLSSSTRLRSEREELSESKPFTVTNGNVQTPPLHSVPSRKRKRGIDEKSSNSNEIERLQRSRAESSEYPIHHPDGKKSDYLEGQPLSRSQNFTQVIKDDGSSPRSSLSRDDRRKFFRSHKIKITQLLGPEASRRSERKSQKEPGDLSPSGSEQQNVDVLPEPIVHFDELGTSYGVSEVILQNLRKQGYATPTEVQLASLPLLLNPPKPNNSRHDDPHLNGSSNLSSDILASHLLSVAPTGSGKTLAFLIPVLQPILVRSGAKNRDSSRKRQSALPETPSAIIVAPTKELAKQITNEAHKLADRSRVKITLVQKGMVICSRDEGSESTGNDEGSVKADVLVSTPLSLVNAMKKRGQNQISLPSVSSLVLDEADVLLDPLFREQTMEIWAACTSPSLRVSLWSATMGSNIEEMATSVLQTKLKTLEGLEKTQENSAPLMRLVVGLKDSSIPNIEHKLMYAATEKGKLIAMRQLIRAPASSTAMPLPQIPPPFLVFTQTISRAVALRAELMYDIPQEAGGSTRVAILHAELSETSRDYVMTQFRKGEIWFLITTDLLARGVDFQGINGVINYDLPNSSAAYVHRAGRTGRAGRKGGVAITLYSKDDLPFVKNVANVIRATERDFQDAREADRSWILKSLPNPTKREKKQLKRRGVESRRTGKIRDDQGRSRNAKSQISTRSGYERRMENNRKGAAESSRRRGLVRNEKDTKPDNDEFEGFEDT